MRIGDIVRVMSKTADPRIGILIRLPRRMFMAGELATVMIDGEVKLVRSELLEIVKSKGLRT